LTILHYPVNIELQDEVNFIIPSQTSSVNEEVIETLGRSGFFMSKDRAILHSDLNIDYQLRVHDMKANGVQITVKDNTLSYRQYQMQLPMATQSPMEIASAAWHLFENNYDWHTFVRAVTVCAINLEPKFMPQQLMLFDDAARQARLEQLDDTIETIRGRFGKCSIYSASLLGIMKTSGDSSHEVIMPGIMYA
jgi:DNA polymerase-4